MVWFLGVENLLLNGGVQQSSIGQRPKKWDIVIHILIEFAFEIITLNIIGVMSYHPIVVWQWKTLMMYCCNVVVDGAAACNTTKTREKTRYNHALSSFQPPLIPSPNNLLWWLLEMLLLSGIKHKEPKKTSCGALKKPQLSYNKLKQPNCQSH